MPAMLVEVTARRSIGAASSFSVPASRLESTRRGTANSAHSATAKHRKLRRSSSVCMNWSVTTSPADTSQNTGFGKVLVKVVRAGARKRGVVERLDLLGLY